MSHVPLKKEERHTIETLLRMNTPVSQIASALGKHRSTIYREIQKGSCIQMDSDLRKKKVYLYDAGQRVMEERARKKGRKKKLLPDDEFLQQVAHWICDHKYSPAAALYRIPDRKLCVKSLYNYIQSGYLEGVSVMSLPYARPKKKKKAKVEKRKFSRGRSIDERPEHILNREEYGHWEMDTVYSSKDDLSCLLVLSERKTREELIFQIEDRTSASVIRELDKYEKKIGTPEFREKFRTITCDNGMEFADWESIERSCRTKGKRTVTYFCHPYRSGERGTNENINRMIRRWIPKGDDIGLYSKNEIQQIEDWINDYPRGIFGGLSSREYHRLHQE